jgi:hypothetical protein
MSIRAGGGAQTAGNEIDANGTSIETSPDSERVADPATKALAGPGEPVGLGETTVGDEEPSRGDGETLGP